MYHLSFGRARAAGSAVRFSRGGNVNQPSGTTGPIGTNHPSGGSFAPIDSPSWARLDVPLGARHHAGHTTFAVYSHNASRVLLEIYGAAAGEDARYDYWMTRGPDDIWRAKVSGAPPGTLYAFRCFGQNWPFSADFRRGNSVDGFIADVDRDGNRFNPN